MEAFEPTAWHDDDTLYIGVDIADEYYLYRHQFAVSSQIESVDLGEPNIPQGTFINDEFMGDVYVFRDQLVFEVPLSTPYSGPLDITLTFQGCADAGLCYPRNKLTFRPVRHSHPANSLTGRPITAAPTQRPTPQDKIQLTPQRRVTFQPPKVKTAASAA